MQKDKITISQLEVLVAICDNNLNITAAANSLGIAQPSVSKKIISLEESLGASMFYRNGKRLQYETEMCRQIVEQARKVLLAFNDLDTIKHMPIADNEMMGELCIGTTHTQARYVLPNILKKFQTEYPKVSLNIAQGKPSELVTWLGQGKIDFAICTEKLETNNNFKTIISYTWNRAMVVPKDHQFASITTPISLKQLAEQPIVTYAKGFTGREAFEEVFTDNNLVPKIKISTSDADIIKTYVRLGFGVGVMAEMAYEKDLDSDLAIHSLGHLFPKMNVRLAYQRTRYLSSKMQRFIDLFDQWAKDR